MKQFQIFSALAGVLALTSCASIVEGTSDRIEVTAGNSQQANCELKNGRGTWNVATPGSTEVKKSKTDLVINCIETTTGARGSKIVSSGMESWVIADIVVAPIISFPVDFISGAAWDYPSDVTVSMTPVAVAPVQMQQQIPMQPQAPLEPQAPTPVLAPITNMPYPAQEPALVPMAPTSSLQEQQYAPASGAIQPEYAANPTPVTVNVNVSGGTVPTTAQVVESPVKLVPQTPAEQNAQLSTAAGAAPSGDSDDSYHSPLPSWSPASTATGQKSTGEDIRLAPPQGTLGERKYVAY